MSEEENHAEKILKMRSERVKNIEIGGATNSLGLQERL